MKKVLALVLSAIALTAVMLALIGCGGGSGGSGFLPSGTGRLSVFVTDSFRDDYDHVWTTVYKVELLTASGTAAALFDDPAGKTMDVKTLRDATGARFAFLSDSSVPAGTYTAVRVTVGSAMTLIPKGAKKGAATAFEDSIPRDAQGHPQIRHTFAVPLAVGNRADDLVVDFDLANFVIAGGKITPSVKEGGKTGVNDINRQEIEDFKGTISNLSGTAPNFTFTLTRSSGMTLKVLTNSSTAIYNSSLATNPTLANGKIVEAHGKFDTTVDQLTATNIKIEDSGTGGSDKPELEGSPSAVNGTAGTFVITVREAKGFVPGQTTVNIVTSANTVFRSASGVTLAATDFFTRLVTAKKAEAEGTYDAATNTLTALRVRLDQESGQANGGSGGSGEAAVTGTPISSDAGTRTFSINPVTEYEGFVYGGGALNVVTDGSTEYKNAADKTISAVAFFNALPSSTGVEVEGVFSAGTITAKSAKIKN